jgi:hypothetical protein
MVIDRNGQAFTYEEYLQTPHWQAKRAEAIVFWEYKCSLCYSEGPLHVHHRNYYRLFGELMNDILVFCDSCHTRHHSVLGLNEKLKYFWEGVYQKCQEEGLLDFWMDHNEENVDKN